MVHNPASIAIDLTNKKLSDIMYLTREPLASAHLANGKICNTIKIAPFTLPEQGRYFLCFIIVTTRVITAQSMMTKVNKSLYVTISTSLLSHSVRRLT